MDSNQNNVNLNLSKSLALHKFWQGVSDRTQNSYRFDTFELQTVVEMISATLIINPFWKERWRKSRTRRAQTWKFNIGNLFECVAVRQISSLALSLWLHTGRARGQKRKRARLPNW